MDERSLKVLEYDKVLAKLAGLAQTAAGRRLAEELRPLERRSAMEAALDETEDMLQYLYREGDLALSAAEEINDILRYCEAGAVPSLPGFLRVARNLRLVAQLKEKLPEDAEPETSILYDRLIALQSVPELAKRIDESIQNEEELFDRASPELYRLRRQIVKEQDDIKQQLQAILKKQGASLQDQLVTLRSDRYVVPVKAEQRSSVPGIVHDSSGSGQTVFIEPLAVVERNNKIRELKVAEAAEIERILRALAAQVAEHAEDLRANAELLAALDFCQAKARLARELRATRPVLNEEKRIQLFKARHPLIPKNQVVPIDFELGLSFDTLVITGPNTGGKTVSLKTCALLSLMAMSGLAIPAAEKSEIAIYREVLADIGDEQSIEQSLSTFSAHIRQIVDICAKADADTLVLLDELGAGTDPSEGAALAIAILDALRQQGANVVATTHYQELKAYALNTPGVSNACCEFDTASLRPTYRLLIGVPGVSNALAISTRLGLPQPIIDAAKALISDEGARFEDLVQAIKQSHDKAMSMEAHLTELEQELEKQKRLLEREREKLKEEKERLLNEAEERAQVILDDAQAEVELILEEIQTKLQQHDPEAARKTALNMRNELQKSRRERREKQRQKEMQKAVAKPLAAGQIEIGAFYKAPALGIQGEAIAAPDAKGQVLLRQGALQVRVPVKALQRVEKAPEAPSKHRSKDTEKVRRDVKLSIKSELQLLGLTVDEALLELDRYIDDAVLAGLDSVRIVHGKGTGALRKAVQDALRKDKRVRSFEQAAFGQGDAGVTIAKLS